MPVLYFPVSRHCETLKESLQWLPKQGKKMWNYTSETLHNLHIDLCKETQGVKFLWRKDYGRTKIWQRSLMQMRLKHDKKSERYNFDGRSNLESRNDKLLCKELLSKKDVNDGFPHIKRALQWKKFTRSWEKNSCALSRFLSLKFVFSLEVRKCDLLRPQLKIC